MIGLERNTVRLVEHQSRWHELFQQEHALLSGLLDDLIIDIQHVGSTAVAGLPAKPILDIAAAIRSPDDIPAIAERLLRHHYLDRGDAGSDGGYLFVKESRPDVRTVHLHLVEITDAQWSEYLAFRDLLRRDTIFRERYASLKRDLAGQFADDRRSYTKGKHEFIRRALRELMHLTDTGIDPAILQRYLDEQIYTLPGVSNQREAFTILLTGSRALGTWGSASDVDLDVLCPREVFTAVLPAAFGRGLIKTPTTNWFSLPREGGEQYYGAERGRPHFSLTPLDQVARQFAEYEDVPLWIWTNARVIADPGGQFARIRDTFAGYPRELLIRKIKYHWLLYDYAVVDIYPCHHHSDDDLLPALTALTTALNELLKLFYLLDGQPYPYTEKLLPLADRTTLGRQFVQFFRQLIGLIFGTESLELPLWQRLDRAGYLLADYESPDCKRLEDACAQAMIAAGLDPAWVEADYDNIDELLWGELGPVP
jgi:GrpB-like predicted nucleotidyltransferase (UPF0157 family)